MLWAIPLYFQPNGPSLLKYISQFRRSLIYDFWISPILFSDTSVWNDFSFTPTFYLCTSIQENLYANSFLFFYLPFPLFIYLFFSISTHNLWFVISGYTSQTSSKITCLNNVFHFTTWRIMWLRGNCWMDECWPKGFY